MEKNTVLIVDDEIMNIYLLSNFLTPLYEIMLSTGGKEALDKVLEHPPDLILLDIMMPDMDGYRVCKKLKNNPLTTNIPVIFTSALDSRNDIKKGYEVGANGYIVKPFDQETILKTVSKYL